MSTVTKIETSKQEFFHTGGGCWVAYAPIKFYDNTTLEESQNGKPYAGDDPAYVTLWGAYSDEYFSIYPCNPFPAHCADEPAEPLFSFENYYCQDPECEDSYGEWTHLAEAFKGLYDFRFNGIERVSSIDFDRVQKLYEEAE